jgi:uncharacterized protein (TIGR02271 family)
MTTRPDSTHVDLTSLIGGNVYDSEGNKLGTAGRIYTSDANGAPEWVTVKTGLFGNKESFVPLNDAQADDKGLHVRVHKDQVKDAPLIDSDGHLSNTETGELYRHYGLTRGGAAPNAGQAGPGQTGQTGQAGTGRDSVPTQRTQMDADTAAQQTRADMNRDAAARPTPTATGREAAAPTGQMAAQADQMDMAGHSHTQSMMRSEEQLSAGTEQVEAGRVRLHKHVVTTQQQITVPIRREEAHVTREPITADQAMADAQLGDQELEVVLHEERPVVTKKIVQVERVTVNTEMIQENREVTDTIRREQIEIEDDTKRPQQR